MEQQTACRTLLAKRIMMAAAGIAVTGISVALFKTAAFGTDPFSCLSLGIWNLSGFSYGIVYPVLNVLLLIGIFFADRHYIGLATVMNLLLMGVIVEGFMDLFEGWLPHTDLASRAVLLAVAVVLMCFSASLYFTADLGVSTYDAWALILTKRTGIPFRACRIGTDILCILAGFLMGAVVGVGTVITALGMGPLIEFFNKKCSEPLLYGKKAD